MNIFVGKRQTNPTEATRQQKLVDQVLATDGQTHVLISGTDFTGIVRALVHKINWQIGLTDQTGYMFPSTTELLITQLVEISEKMEKHYIEVPQSRVGLME